MELYTIPIPNSPGKFILYRPLAGLAFVGNRAMATLAQASDSGAGAATANADAVEFLRAAGFIDPDPALPPSPGTEFRPMTAVLLMTNRCQLRCTYCYASAGESVGQELSADLGYAAIDQVCQNALDLGRPQFEVSFHGGGEPTFVWKTLQACTEYARQKPLPAKITLTSNGIWSKPQCDWITAHLDGLTLSMDGSQETQDRQRPFADGRGSFDQVMHTVKALDAAGFSYAIRLTATAPWSDLPGDVRFLCEATHCTAMQVEPAFNVKRGGHAWPDTAEAQAFIDGFLDAVDIARRAGRHLHYSGARLGTVATTFCTAPYDALIVNPNGDLVACYEIAGYAHPLGALSTIGRIEDNTVVIDEAARNHLHSLMAERRTMCQDCFCYWSCAGDCYTRAFGSGPDGHLYRSVRCDMNRAILQNLLLRGIADGNGLWRGPMGGVVTYRFPQSGETIP